VGSVQWMKSRAAIAALGLISATVILASACSSGAGLGNKAGPADQPVVLQMADLNAGTDLHGTPEIQYFVQRVSDLSRGQMSVKVVYSVGGLAMNAEQQVVKDVAAGASTSASPGPASSTRSASRVSRPSAPRCSSTVTRWRMR
jgi:hypothetical protein